MRSGAHKMGYYCGSGGHLVLPPPVYSHRWPYQERLEQLHMRSVQLSGRGESTNKPDTAPGDVTHIPMPDTLALALEALLRNQPYAPDTAAASVQSGAPLPRPSSDPPHDTDCSTTRSSFLTSTP